MNTFRYGALFDMDGVLVDNAFYHTKAYEIWCQERKIPFDSDAFMRLCFGKQNRAIFRFLLNHDDLDEETIRQWGDEKEAIYREIYDSHVQEIPGLSVFLKDLEDHGFGIAVATSGSIENVNFVLGHLGITDYFSAVVTAADITEGKPNPQVFLTSAAKIGMDPKDCVVFEDSLSGAKAGVSSGARLIGVSTELPQLPGADRMIHHFTEITALNVMNLIEKGKA